VEIMKNEMKQEIRAEMGLASDTRYFIVPGLGSSGPAHWQTYFGQSLGNIPRIGQRGWDAPICSGWIATTDLAVSKTEPETVVLIGHSLGCTAIAHWATRYGRIIEGALLVAPSDIEAPPCTFPSEVFAPIPLQKPPFPAIVVASASDPWVSLDRAQFFARHWGSTFLDIGDAGHINTDSGHGPWRQGLEILGLLQ